MENRTAYIPPPNFGMVEEDLYRSGEPKECSFPYMSRLNLKTIIYLEEEEPSKTFLNFVHDQGINLIKVAQKQEEEGIRQGGPLSEEIVLGALEIILDSRNYPIAIMDHTGRHRTGTIIGCLRKVQKWHLQSILDEFKRFTGSKIQYDEHKQFIELFDTDLVSIPTSQNRPRWL